jgi:2-methylisocitrate lyase-like PEP mutase family enzyme
MIAQDAKASKFRALHVRGNPLVLFNVWDAGSAKAVAAADAQSLATGSWAVAAAHGFSDGEQLSLELVLANLRRIVVTTDLPVSIDIESGYEDPARTIEATLRAGAVGCNLEDSFPRDGTLRSIDNQVARISQCRKVVAASGINYFINARTDVFLQKGFKGNEIAFVQMALDRANAYADAGADGIFVPGLHDLELVSTFTQASPLPVNIMLSDGCLDVKDYAKLGVARLSFGPTPYLKMMKVLEQSAHDVFRQQRMIASF